MAVLFRFVINFFFVCSCIVDLQIWCMQEEVAREFGIPVQFQRFWLWAKRQNHTYRPNRPLTPMEETQSVNIFCLLMFLYVLCVLILFFFFKNFGWKGFDMTSLCSDAFSNEKAVSFSIYYTFVFMFFFCANMLI
jgi:hypothetical protein